MGGVGRPWTFCLPFEAGFVYGRSHLGRDLAREWRGRAASTAMARPGEEAPAVAEEEDDDDALGQIIRRQRKEKRELQGETGKRFAEGSARCSV